MILTTSPKFTPGIIAFLRIVIGFFIAFHGIEIFDANAMQKLVEWDKFKSTPFLPYLGKGAELVAGLLLVLGLFTRIASLITIGVFAYIVFFVGNGKFWMDDQHPFLLALFGLLFFFTGPGFFAMDNLIFRKR